MTSTLSLKLSVNPGAIGNAVMRKGLYDEYNNGLLNIVDELEKHSPTGATGLLKNSWDIQAPRKETCSLQIYAKIINNAPDSLYRIAGRGPGKLPPYQPLYAWASAKGFPEKTQAIRKNIAKYGTLRWRQKTNWVGINNDGSVIPGGRLWVLWEELKSKLERRF